MSAHVELVRAATERFAVEGPRALLEHYDEVFTEDFLWKPALVGTFEGGEYRGRAGFAQYLRDFEASFAEMDPRDPTFEEVGEDTVLVRVHMRVRGMESGVPLEQQIGWVFRFDGNRIGYGETFMSWEAAEAEARA